MSKLKNPLLSFGARGSLAKIVSFVRRRRTNIVEKIPLPADAKSYDQLSWRTMFLMARDLWLELSPEEKRTWESAGTTRHLTGYMYFMSQALRPNPGIYLPLLGGTMQGDIAMAAFKIENLPDPAADQDAATKAYVDLAIAAIHWDYFFSNTPSGIGAYFTMFTEPTGEAESTFTSAALGGGDDQALFQWISKTAVPFAMIEAGVISIHIHAERTIGNRSVNIYAEIYEYTSLAAEVLIATTETSEAVIDAVSSLSIHATLAADYEIALTSKLLVKFYANIGGAGAATTVALYAEGTSSARIAIPTPAGPLVDALIAAHAAIAAAHHARYTDAEAVAAVDIGEGHINILPHSYDSIGQGTWFYSVDSTQFMNGHLIHAPTNDGNNLTYKVYLAAGTYTLRVLGTVTALSAIMDFDIDDVEIASFDWYAGASARNQVRSQTGIVVATSGLKDLKLRVDGKNVLSGGLIVYLTSISLWRTA